jgi:hypothetical protein
MYAHMSHVAPTSLSLCPSIYTSRRTTSFCFLLKAPLFFNKKRVFCPRSVCVCFVFSCLAGRRFGATVPGPRRVAIISGPTGGRRCLRCGTLLKRGPRVRSSWYRSSSSSGTPGPGVARELPFKSHFKGEAKLVAAGRKGSGGAWGSTSRAKWSNTNTDQKKVPKWRSPGCGLQFGGAENDLLAIKLQSSNTLFSAARTSNSRCLVLWSKDAVRVILF